MDDLRWTGEPPDARLQRLLGAAGFRAVREASENHSACVVFTRDAKRVPAPPGEGMSWLWLCGGRVPAAAATEAVVRGAYEVLSLQDRDLALRLPERLRELHSGEGHPLPPATSVANSPAARAVLLQAARAARTSQPVLITGETGTGKEITARLIHQWSARARAPFIPINCAAIPNELMEGELFGYAKGAFSGAVRAYDGQMLAAEGGTVFLDEVDDTPLPLQVKLLRVLEDRVVSRLGENVWRQVNFRLVAATNRDLRELIKKGLFGSDFYERLAIVSIQLPPLRERPEDLPLLVRHFIARFYREEPEAKARAEVQAVSPAAMEALAAYPWPGNIRELRNVLFESLVYKRAGQELLLSDLPRRILVRSEPRGERGAVDADGLRRRIGEGAFSLRREVEELERAALVAALAAAGGNATRAASLLGEVGRGTARDPGGTVRAMMRRLGVAAPRGSGR